MTCDVGSVRLHWIGVIYKATNFLKATLHMYVVLQSYNFSQNKVDKNHYPTILATDVEIYLFRSTYTINTEQVH